MSKELTHLQVLRQTHNRTWKEEPTSIESVREYKDLSHVGRGIAGEAGEIQDALKKHLDYGQPLDVDNVEEEIGDCLFYLSKLASLVGITLESCIDANREKLQKRYPEGFSVEAAKERADKT